MNAVSSMNWGLGVAITIGAFLGAFALARSVRRSLRNGTVRYGGNTIAMRPQTFHRSNTPGLYWFGIVLHVGCAAGLAGWGVYMVAIMATA